MSTDRDRPGQRLRERLFKARLAAAMRGPTPIVWCIAVALLLIHLATSVAIGLGSATSDQILLAGGLMPERVLQGEWWRLLSGPLLHRGWPHLAMNVIGVVLIGRPLESAFGSVRLWWVWAGATGLGALGSLSAGHLLTVGASAAVFGFIGALVAIGLRLWSSLAPGMRMSLVLLPAAVIGLILAMGLVVDQIAGVEQVDHHAHIAGSLGGVLMGLILRLPLRDSEGAIWDLAAGSAAARMLRWGGVAVGGLFLAGFATSMTGVGQSLQIDPPEAGSFRWQGQDIAIPADWRSGVWRGGRCAGALVDGAWALQERRVLCYALPMGGALLIGRRDQLLTLDDGDFEVMDQANRDGAFVRRQAGVLLHPIGAEHLYIVIGPDALLPTWRNALEPLLARPGSATISRPPAGTPPTSAPTTRRLPAHAPAGRAPLDRGASDKQALRVVFQART